MKASKLIVSTAAILATLGAMGVASAQTTTTPSSATTAPVPSTSKATDPNREAQQRTNKPVTASPADAWPVNRSTSGMNDGGASTMDKSNTGRMNSTVPNTTDNSSTGTTMNATPNAGDNTSTMNRNPNANRNSNDNMGTTAERAPRADRN